MGKVGAGMPVSLDGFVNDRDGGLDRLYPDMAATRESEAVRDAIRDTGGVVMGRRTYDMGGGDYTGYEFQVPIFVLTHRADDGDVPPGHARFVTGVEACAREARAAAGDRAVMVHGVSAAQALLRAELMDDMEIHLVGVLLGEGRRLFDRLGNDPIEVNLVRRLDDRDVTHLRYRVRRPGGAA